MEQIIEGFQEEYPNVEVDYEIKADGDCYILLQTAIQSGSGPDLFWTNGTATANMPDLVSNDACADLRDLVDYSFISDAAMDLATISENNPDLNFGAFTIPSEDGTTGLVGTSANGFSVNAASDNMDAAVAFANYCATKEAQTIWVQS